MLNDAPLKPKRRTVSPRRQFGQAGQLLTSREQRENAEREARHRQQEAESERAAREAWQRGEVVPHRITVALDINEIDGPGVDEACGVREPAVDEWEEGVRYPSWDQLYALAELTGYPVGFFASPVRPSDAIRVSDTTLIFHMRGKPIDDPEPVLAFTPEAIAATLGGYCAGCLRPGGRAIHTCEQDALF